MAGTFSLITYCLTVLLLILSFCRTTLIFSDQILTRDYPTIEFARFCERNLRIHPSPLRGTNSQSVTETSPTWLESQISNPSGGSGEIVSGGDACDVSVPHAYSETDWEEAWGSTSLHSDRIEATTQLHRIETCADNTDLSPRGSTGPTSPNEPEQSPGYDKNAYWEVCK